MTKRMLIDATHAEETRVVVLDGNRLEDFDVETSTKRQLKGNIYLAKIVRVEPSLQAAFVEYGGGRHGFLAFGEIHPDYYQIPVADRQRLLALQAEEARAEAEAEEEEADAEAAGRRPARPERHERQPARDETEVADEPTRPATDAELGEPSAADHELAAKTADEAGEPAPQVEPEGPEQPAAQAEAVAEPTPAAEAAPLRPEAAASAEHAQKVGAEVAAEPAPQVEPEADAPAAAPSDDPHRDAHRPAQAALITREERFGATDAVAADEFPGESMAPAAVAGDAVPAGDDDEDTADGDEVEVLPPPETVGGEAEQENGAEEARARRTSRFLRNYRIQEVIKRRQIMLVQVVKEERGTKGAALTTYISLAGRFCVLMPNSPRGGGISRKITSAADRRRLKEITAELDIPQGMGLIVRTAGANRPKPEIKRDCEYLMRLWDDIREHTLRSVAPALIYEEASLIKRAIRDVYSRDIDEVVVDGEDGWKAAHDFMRMLMPSHAKKVQLWRGNGGGPNQPLFAKYQVEAQLDGMLTPTVQLKSGGYLVINQAEALVAIDVNSGRSTRERGIEETALRTNLEAADEVARQLRLRDLAGLIVIDFIDMEAKKHNAAVERRIKDALKIDRARIQVGHISHFGLLEMSRQRLRPSLAETSFVVCPHCGGLGHVRSTESAAIHVLRAIEEEGGKGRAALIMVFVASSIALYLLNTKRDRLAAIEARYAMRVHFTPDDTLVPPQIRIDRVKPQVPESERPVFAAPVAPAAPAQSSPEEEFEEAPDIVEDEEEETVVVARAPAPQRAEARAEPRAEARSEQRPEARGEARPTGEDAGRRRRRRRRRGNRRDQVAGGVPGQPASETGGEPPANGGEAFEDQFEGEDGEPADVFMAEGPGDDGEAPAALAEAAEAEAGGIEQPSLDAADLDENGLPKPRRRGRRGGRRRRRGEGEAEEPAVAEPPAAPYIAPYIAPYSGPTPADPFGGGAFDIFDMMDAAADAGPPPLPSVHAPAPSPIVAVASEPVAAAPPEAPAEAAAPVAEPAVVEPPPPAAPELAPEFSAVPEPALEAAPEPAAALAPELPAEPSAEPIVGPAIKPLVLGQDDLPVAERKRGWWKR